MTEASLDRAVAELAVDLGAVVANWRLLDRRARDTGGRAAAVLKADAYGLGAERVGPALHAAGCRTVFVAHPAEAVVLRPLLPDTTVAVLNGLWPGNAADYRAHGLTPVLGSLPEIEAWGRLARAGSGPLPALLHVDTGMNRLGLAPAEVDRLVADPAPLAGIDVLYVMTHLVSAEVPEDPVNEAQRRRFAAVCARLPHWKRSLANSSGLFLGAGFGSDLARPGAAIYGVNPVPGRANPMRATVRLRARILQVREIGAGDSVGYNGQWVAARPSRIGTVSVGYADGFLRSLGNRAVACFDGRAVPLVGRVSMDLSTFDLTDVPEALPGTWLELIGPGNTVDQLAEQAGTNGYEVLTSLGRRYHRVYSPA